MLKKLLVAAALAMPAAAFASSDFVIRFEAPTLVSHSYDRNYHGHYGNGHYQAEQRALSWVNREQAEQRARIEQGIRSGELTRSEAERLFREQSNIREMERRYVADRHLSQREFANLQEELRDASRNIQQQKNDREDRDRNYRQYGYNRW